jgi:hypothetical protein
VELAGLEVSRAGDVRGLESELVEAAGHGAGGIRAEDGADGPAFAVLDRGSVDAVLPGGDQRRGGGEQVVELGRVDRDRLLGRLQPVRRRARPAGSIEKPRCSD